MARKKFEAQWDFEFMHGFARHTCRPKGPLRRNEEIRHVFCSCINFIKKYEYTTTVYMYVRILSKGTRGDILCISDRPALQCPHIYLGKRIKVRLDHMNTLFDINDI